MKQLLLLFLLFNSVYAKTPTLDEMIAQMIVIGFDGQKEGDKWVEQITKDVKREKIGGIILGDKNIQSPQQLKKLTHYLQTQAPQKLPLLIIAEEEGGDNSLLDSKKGFESLPSANDMVKNYDIYEAEKKYMKRSAELSRAGINVNFAPVLDLHPKEGTKISRSYSSYEELVTTYAMLFVQSLKEHSVVATIKYFPTAGSNLWDDFSTQVDVSNQWRFEQLKPYYDLIASKNVQAVLMSHVIQKELDKTHPALFSPLIIEGLLRGKMHFDGVVFVDNLRTNSLPQSIDFKGRIIRSIQAGADVLVFTNYFADNASIPFTVTKIIQDAVRSGELTKERIALSYERIEKLKSTLAQRPSHVD